MELKENEIMEKIIRDIEWKFEIRVYSTIPVYRGWKNFKWVLETNVGKLFAKQYSPMRYSLERLSLIEVSLTIQDRLNKNGIPCPKLYRFRDRFVLQTNDGINYTLMDYIEGVLVKPGEVNIEQIYDLGKAIGYMHTLLKKIPATKTSWSLDKEKILKSWRDQWERAQILQPSSRVIRALENQWKIVNQIQLDDLRKCHPHWIHWDLWVDNFLFSPTKCMAILDFDRVKVGYCELDIARALLSCTFDSYSSQLNLETVSSFVSGYNEHLPLSKEDLIRSLRLLWCYESPKWCWADVEEWNHESVRFFEEILWISDYWNELKDVVDLVVTKVID
ncbi:phosphotransferase [Lihuaxuella thermophila]|uniref:Homoserine kinase type II n=1 Tax=Lihuaxuella thermophila TaxID=1173111 RepID=A0A1H8CI32_9BACL|nr:phosphotransferase [Lihuaxuella thermophila]SEM94670.1 homoserine kinase type II [Lihuaxuella thermophila]